MVALPIINRRNTVEVKVGSVTIGNGYPVVVQSMTNTDTADITKTIDQVMELSDAGSEIIRLTVNNDASAKAIPIIKETLLSKGYEIPLAGCFHYNGHKLLNDYPECAEALDKYRINPGNVGFGQKRETQFELMIKAAIKFNKAVRIGVNWGSIDQALSAKLMDENAKSESPLPSDYILREALIMSALSTAAKAEEMGLGRDKIIISCKVSRVQDLVAVYTALSDRSNYALHLGLTEAGIGDKGVVATTAALSILLQNGIGDTIRASLTPEPGASRTREITVCQELLQSLGLRSFAPQVIACPGCGRTTSTFFQSLASDIQSFLRKQMPIWRETHPEAANMNVAVMGCIVNGPGESKHADIGISLPGTGESPVAPVFVDGIKKYTLRGDNIAKEFQNIVTSYVETKYNKTA